MNYQTKNNALAITKDGSEADLTLGLMLADAEAKKRLRQQQKKVHGLLGFDEQDLIMANVALNTANLSDDWMVEFVPFIDESDNEYCHTLALINKNTNRFFTHRLTGHAIHIVKAKTSFIRSSKTSTRFLSVYPDLELGDDSVGLGAEYINIIDELLPPKVESYAEFKQIDKTIDSALISAIHWIIKEQLTYVFNHCELPDSLGGL